MLVRSHDTVYTFVFTDYKYSLYNLAEESLEWEKAKHEAHIRSATRLKDLCFKNGGIYIKLGQHIGQLVCSCEHKKNLIMWILLELSHGVIIDTFDTKIEETREETEGLFRRQRTGG